MSGVLPVRCTYVFQQDWELKYNAKPILRQEELALTPMVFVFSQERFDAFSKARKSLSGASNKRP